MSHIRRARANDAAALAALAESSFRATFAADNLPAHMDAHCRANYGEAIQRAEIADPLRITLLCEEAGALIGYAQLRRGPAPACVDAACPGEIVRLYVLADWHGRGVAQALMQASLDALRDIGVDVVWLGVWEHNPRAIAFYSKSGFVEVGEHIFNLGGDPQRDRVMERPIRAIT